MLRLVTTVFAPATYNFVATERFVSTDILKFSLGDNFKQCFLPKVEQNMHAMELGIYQLTRSAPNQDICAKLTEEYQQTALAYLYELLTRQAKGERGLLLTNGSANIFYILDISGTLWAVNARWCNKFGYWSMGTRSNGSPVEWNEGYRVISRAPRT